MHEYMQAEVRLPTIRMKIRLSAFTALHIGDGEAGVASCQRLRDDSDCSDLSLLAWFSWTCL
jgi:hypothetical protein